MKRFVVILVVLFAASGAFATSFSFIQFQSAFQDFANGAASALPLESSVGLNWSDAYIGQFPHLGIGVTAGAATIPYSAVNKAVSAFQGSLPSNLSFLSSIGIPLPAYTIDVRIGGFILPFDIGLKFGYLPPNFFSSSFSADYLLVGGDIRYALLKDSGSTPGLSVGVGYTYMRGYVSLPGVLGHSVQVTSVQLPDGTNYPISFTDPKLDFLWNTSVIDAKVQLSKSFFIITPYVGLGASYGISNAGGGMSSNMQINGLSPTQAQIDAINQATGSNYTLSNPGFAIKASASGFSARAFGGFSFNLFFLKIGLGAEYEFLSGSMAAMVNARLQF
jgi:hypothetical protein